MPTEDRTIPVSAYPSSPASSGSQAGLPSASAARRVPRFGPRRGLSYRAVLLLMLAPYLVGMALLVIAPALMGLPLAFTDYNLLSPPQYVGLANFTELFRDEIFHKSVFNSLFYIGLAVPIRLVGAIVMALLLFKAARLIGGFRAAVYLPTVVPDIAWALIWLWLLNPIYGPINQLLAVFGLPGPPWMTQEWSARYAIVLMMVWQIGEGLIVFLAALGDIPREVHEQSAVDGAANWQSLFRITLPLMAPIILIMLFRDTIFSLQVNFVPALIVGRGGGPNFSTTFIPMYIYTQAFEYLRFGYAAAITWFMYGLTALLLFAQYRVAVRWRLGFRNAED